MRINQHFSAMQLREQIEKIQEVCVQPVEAAMSFDNIFPIHRIKEARRIQNDPTPYWRDYEELSNALHAEWSAATGNPSVVGAIVYAMAEVSKKIDPDRVPSVSYMQLGDKLMMVVQGTYTAGAFSRAIDDVNRGNAAFTYCQFLERANNKIYDQDELIKKLLGVNHSQVRYQVASLLSRTTNLIWRKNPHSVGLIKAIREEHNNDNRNKLVLGLTHNRPDCLLKEYNLPGYGSCVLMRHIQGDPILNIEINVSYWVYHALKAESKEGEYYSKFSEKPNFSEDELANAIKYTTKTIDRYKSKNDLSPDDVIILHNSLAILTEVLEIATSDQVDSNSQGPISHELKTLCQRDLIFITHAFFKRETELPTVETILPTVVKYRLCEENYPLEYLYNLKSELSRRSREFSPSNMGKINKAIDSGLISYFNENPQRQIRFSSVDNFNKSISVLLDGISPQGVAIDITLQPNLRFIHSDAERLTFLRELHELNTSGIVISTETRSPFSIVHALDFSSSISRENRELLTTSLIANTHTGDRFPELKNPTLNTVSGASLTLFRSLTPSFKDYYGGKAIKELGIQFAQTVIRRQINRDKVGLLLSGPKGTGKSLFGQVLANEIGLPLITISGAEIKDGQIYYPPTKRYYSTTDFFQKLTTGGKAVLLIDEFESLVPITNPQFVSQILRELELIKSINSPIIVIGTTNCPNSEIVVKSKITSAGTSIELNKELESYVDTRAIAKFQPCYLFHLPVIGSEFALDYIKHLTIQGRIIGEVPDTEIVRLCKRLSAGALKSKIDRVVAESRSVQALFLSSELKIMQLATKEIQSLARKINAKITSSFAEREIDEDKNINYAEVAFMVEDLSTVEISRKIDLITGKVNQQKLIEFLLS